MLEEIKLLLGNSVTSFSDAQIGLAAKMALQFVEDYTGCEADYSLTLLAERIAIVTLNRMNTEGLSSMTFNGTSESYLNDIPEDIKKALNRKRKVLFV